MSNKNKFGFEPLDDQSIKSTRRRSVGPMGAAVREAAENLQESTEVKVEQRRQNAVDAKEFRQAKEEGRVLVHLPINKVEWDDLPRDRINLEEVADSEEMEELMSSIMSRGQREPIEVYRDTEGKYQLKKGWRRLTAIRQLHETRGGDRFTTVVARVSVNDEDRLGLYVDMVEENVIREDLTFAEMANVAITAAGDSKLKFKDAEDAVNYLYGALHKMKRSYIRAFVYLQQQLGSSLNWPKAVSRNLGVEVSRKLRSDASLATGLKASLKQCVSDEEQQKVLSDFVAETPSLKPKAKGSAPREKFEFHVGATKVTARNGEIRIVGKADYTEVPKDQLEEAIRAFQAVLGQS